MKKECSLCFLSDFETKKVDDLVICKLCYGLDTIDKLINYKKAISTCPSYALLESYTDLVKKSPTFRTITEQIALGICRREMLDRMRGSENE